VTYSNLSLAAAISSPDHRAWQWLAKRSGRIAGLSLKLRLGLPNAAVDADQLPDWMQPLQTLSGIPCVQLKIDLVSRTVNLDHPCIAQWLKQHGPLISHVDLETNVGESWQIRRDFSKAVSAPSRSIDLTVLAPADQVFDLADLAPVAHSLCSLTCAPSEYDFGTLKGASAINSMSQLTALRIGDEDLESEEPWGSLANLTGLQHLHLDVQASGDPSPLSALTRLTNLNIRSTGWLEAGDRVPFRFTRLQPLSTLRQLKSLRLGGHACAATSLQGLAELSNLKQLEVEYEFCGGSLKSLEGISPGVVNVSIKNAPDLVTLAGIDSCESMEKLSFLHCGVSSLQPLRSLSSIKELIITRCSITSLEGLYSMSLQSLRMQHCSSLTQLSGVEHLPALESLEVIHCGVTSLQPLCLLGEGLQKLSVYGCKGVQEEVLVLPRVRPTADVQVCFSNVKDVVLAGGVQRVVESP
jgi:Leucine-rich repeat (LRR) protein